MLKRICSLLTLIVLVLTQCFTPMNYVLAESDAEQDFQVEEKVNQEEEEETINISEDTDDLITDIEDEKEITETITTEDEELTEDTSFEVQDREEEQEEGEITGITSNIDNEETTEATVDTGNNEQTTETSTTGINNNEEATGLTTGTDNNEQTTQEQITPSVETGDNEEGIIGEITEEIEEIITKIRYFFKKEGDNRYIKYGKDSNNIGTITLKDPNNWASITIMDKNLGAESVGVGKSSYGYYFQWGNNHGVKTVNSSNKTTQKAIYKDSYYSHGYDGGGLFIVGDTDYWDDGAHYNSLWGSESKESSRYGACPVGYHIPTIKEWNELLEIWGKIHTQDVSNDKPLLRYSVDYSRKNIHTLKDAATLCGEGDIECIDEDKLSVIAEVLSSELKLPMAGSYDENGNYHDGLGVYWTTISKNGNKAGVFDVDAYVCNGEDERLLYKSEGHSIRCFQNIYPYEAPAQPENNDNEEQEQQIQEQQQEQQQEQIQQEQTQNTYSVNNIPKEYVSYTLVLGTEKELINLELKANGGKFENEEETKTLKYGYYNQEATINVEALKQDEDRSGYELEEGAEKQLTIPVGYKLMDEIETPNREGYDFGGWYTETEGGEKVDIEKDTISENTQLYAHWIAKEYTITWKNEDGTVRDVTKVLYGQMPTHEDPIQPTDGKYSYIFVGWEPSIKVVDGDAEYRAKYTYLANKCTITWKNEDGTIIDTTEVGYGEMPIHEDPIQPSDEKYSYTFSGWYPEISKATGDVEYKATYVYTPNTYTVTRENENGIVLEIDTGVEYGTIPTYDGESSEKQPDGIYEYSFDGWEPEVSEVIGDVVYVAKYRIVELDNAEDEGSGEDLSLPIEVSEDIEDDGDLLCLMEGSGSKEIEGGDEVIDIQDSLDDNDVFEGEEDQGFFEGLWETLKSFFLEDEDGYLRGSETINDIIVSIEAEEGTFPVGTEVVIKGVPQERLESIQTSLIEDENNNVTEDAQILAFDISFVYSGEEIQPSKEVSVKFNYKENEDFQGARLSELSVYHIDDETDEGEKIEVVSKDGDEIEILATDFSTYAVVAQKGLRGTGGGRGIMDQMPDFNFTGIEVPRPASLSGTYKESPAVYIVMDRNLGAIEAGRGLSSYGYLYQFGNNYGFSGEQGSTAINRREADVDLTEYSNNNPYFSGTFVLGKKQTASGTTTTPDWAMTGNDNIWGGEAIKESYRQGPCPSGWHVPTISEWNDVIDYWAAANGGMNISNFASALKLPLPGSLSRSYGNYYGTSYGNEGYYWSTSTSNDSSKPSDVLQIKSTDYNSRYPENRANGYSVRCFKDDDTIYSITYNDGINNDEVFADQIGTGMRGDSFPSFVGGNPEWDGEGNRSFIGWYTEKNGEYVYVDTLHKQITSNITLYAKRSACEEGECIVPPDTILVAYDMDVYFAVNSGNTSHYTLMDRNLGADLPGTGSNSYGDLFQWGNNYGFSNTGYLPSKTTRTVNASQNGPGNYYYSSTFIYNSNGSDWSSPSNNNLWGDATDTSVARQGPCPDGYHVPSSGEWLSLYNSWYSINGAAICSSISNCAEKIKNDLLLPAVGRINEKAVIGLQDAASYWSSSFSTTANKSYGFYLRAADKEKQIQPNNEDYRTRARSVRCVKNTENTPMQINLNGGILGSVSVYGKKLHYLTDPTKSGFIFAGWYSNNALTTKIEDGGSIGRNITALYAKWNAEGEVEYTFNANGGMFEIEDSGDIIETETFVQTYMEGDPFDATQIEEPTRECYTFSGWYDAASGGNQIQFSTTVTTPITAYAHWVVGNCTITTGVVGDGNITIYPEQGPYAYSSAVTFTAVPGAGYIFDKWMLNEEEILSGESLTLNLTLTGNINLTGYFMPSEMSTHTVTIVSNNAEYGSVSESGVVANDGTQISTSDNILTIGFTTVTATPSTGTEQYTYTFSGWNNTCGNILTGDCTITANFESLLRTYTLDLVVNTGIETIYYKINGADSFTTTGVTTTISGVEAGSTIYAYAEAKDGYTHVDTSSGSPWSVLVTGNNVFSPEAVANTGIQYTVYHYVKRVGENTYALTDTDILSGTTDQVLTLSSLSKASEFMCAHYSGGSLTGTESGPGEIVTETTIKGDNSTKIYLYYTRESHRVTLVKDEHTESVTGDGVRECGSEVPVDATPEPGYHFVRWDREENRRSEESENDKKLSKG